MAIAIAITIAAISPLAHCIRKNPYRAFLRGHLREL
jgi:hypothetical protein